MTSIGTDVEDYLGWMCVHNYAKTTIVSRRYYLGYFTDFLAGLGIGTADAVTLEDLLGYQHQLFLHRKTDGSPLSFATQMQRLAPVAQLFSWLRRQGRIAINPAADLIVPRPDRTLPEATLTISEMAALLAVPDVNTALGLRDRAVMEVFYSTGLRRAELISLAARDVDFERGIVFVRCGKGGKDRYVPIGERALFWTRLYIELVRPGFVTDRFPEHLFLSSVGTPLCPDWVSRKVRRYMAKAGVHKKGSCHLLRHHHRQPPSPDRPSVRPFPPAHPCPADTNRRLPTAAKPQTMQPSSISPEAVHIQPLLGPSSVEPPPSIQAF